MRKIFMIMFIISVVFVGVVTVASDPVFGQPQPQAVPVPVVKNGTCPSGYQQSGNYCTPMFGGTVKPVIPKVGQCPSGYTQSGDYCRKL